MIEEHFKYTGSPVAAEIHEDWNRQVDRFWVLRASRPTRVVEQTSASSTVDA